MLNPVQEKNGATVTATLLTGLNLDEFFTRTDGVGVRALLPDALGSTVALGDGTGTLQPQCTYEPLGLTTQTGVASTNGSAWEPDTSGHGGKQWKRWPDRKSWEEGETPKSVWPDECVRK